MDFLKVVVVILFFILTIATVRIHPEMHQPMMIEDENFQLTRITDNLKNIPVSSAKTETQPVQQQTVNTNQPVQQIINVNTSTPPMPQQNQYVQQQPAPETNKTIKYTNNSANKTTNTSNNISQQEMLNRILKDIRQETPQTPKTVQKPAAAAQTNQPQNNHTLKNPYMTDQEEIIAWNIWRSNIQNQIMKDSDIDYAPLGTIFLFTFVVDKYGNVSNIKVECSNPNYMDIARQNVKPAISHLQGRPILNFPRGTRRISTVVTGLFVIGTQERYSTPNDFSDYERVKQ